LFLLHIDPRHTSHRILYSILSNNTKGNEDNASRMESQRGNQPHSTIMMQSANLMASKDGEKKINSSSKLETIGKF